ncbi:MAG: alpha/beta fold hydrolase [Solirubrobacterales bacterium]|nr:alpha/beta fold hydrolase [Solirubrobacterales bacterium]
MPRTSMGVQPDRRRPRFQAFHAVLLGIVVVAGLLAYAAQTAAGARVRRAQPIPHAVVGSCSGRTGVLCGNIKVPLYWSAPRRGSLHVHFEVYLHSDSALPALEPIVAMEGGPGYPSTGSAASYLFMIGSLHRRHDLILMDQRGTGGSDAIDCTGVQDYDALARPDHYSAVVAACARRLAGRANAYGSAAVAEDLRAVLEAIHVRKVDLYGDSYGSYAAQVFAVHYPRFVRDLVLDGTYNEHFDPLEPEAMTALRRAWDTICRSFAACKRGGLLDDIASFDRQLARHPIVGVADDESHTPQHIDLTAGAFAQLVFDATYSYTFYRDLPAALVAARHRDLVPIKRLAAEDAAFNAGGGAPSSYSAGDLAAVSCHDYPTAWDRRSSGAARAAELARAIGRLRARVFFPFPKRVWLASLDENELVYGCLRWPRTTVPDPPFPPSVSFPRIPVLVLDGLLDQATPLGDASRVAAAWPDATFVPVANSNHITAQVDFLHCVSVITRRYLATGRAGDTSCAGRVPAQYVVPRFPTSVQHAPEAVPAGPADHSTRLGRQTAWVATETVGDALERWYNLLAGGPGYGLYGGSFGVSGGYYAYGPLVLRFHSTRFVPDLAVSGTATWDRKASVLRARLTVAGPHGLSGRLRIEWSTDEKRATATEELTIDKRSVTLEMPAAYSAHG